MDNLNNNINNTNNKNFHNLSNPDINLEISSNQNPNEEMLKDIVENFLQKKLSKENELKYQIGQNKKNILEKFYSLTNTDYLNQQNKNKLQEAEYNFNQQNNNIPKINLNQDEYDEIREKYKNERNKKKSSIFKSEDLHISNTDIVHIKKEDYSPINPNVVDIENKNNIFIIQKRLFENNNDVEGDKVEDIDEIELDFSEIYNKYEESQIVNTNNKNNLISEKTTEKKIYENLGDINNYCFNNDILVKKREIELCFILNNNKNNKKLNGFNEYNKIKQKMKNYSVQLVSSLGYFNNYSNSNKKREKNFSNIIKNNIIFGKINENNDIKNKTNLNYLRNNNINQNLYENNNGKIINNNENNENDNSNNTIITINNNYYNGKFPSYDNKLINGSNNYQSNNINNNQTNNNTKKNKYLIKYKTSFNKNINFNNNSQYFDYKNFSGKTKIKKFNKKIKNDITPETKTIKSKNYILKKKNNSFVLNRDNNKINNNIINKQMYQTINNIRNNINHNNDNNNNKVKNSLNYNNSINNGKTQNNKVIPIISQIPISLKVKKNIISKISLKTSTKNNNKKIGNKNAILNSILNNKLIIFQKVHQQHEAVEKLKIRPNNGVYFLYVDKVNEGYSFKGIYKRGPSEINHICNKIYGIPNTPLMLSYEKFYILVENEEKTFEFKKLSDINVLSFAKTILLIKKK